MKQQFDRNWLEDYKRIPRQSSYLQNYFNGTSTAPNAGVPPSPTVPASMQDIPNIDVDQREQEGLSTGEQQWREGNTELFSQLPEQYRTLPPNEIINYLTGLYNQRQNWSVPKEQFMTPEYMGLIPHTIYQQPIPQQPENKYTWDKDGNYVSEGSLNRQ